MANFIEFLKSGKSAKEFIDTAVLPENPLAVVRVRTSPEPYQDEEVVEENDSDIIPEPDSIEPSGVDAEDKAHDIMDDTVLDDDVEDVEEPDDTFMRQLEALERSSIE